MLPEDFQSLHISISFELRVPIQMHNSIGLMSSFRRLLLVLHGSWQFLHEVQTKLLPNTIDSSSTVHQQTSLSVGLVVKKYWNKLMHLFSILQQHEVRPDDVSGGRLDFLNLLFIPNHSFLD